jgi:hypothetical protein
MKTTSLALASLFLAVSGLEDESHFIHPGDPAYDDDGERHEAGRIKLRFFNQGMKNSFDVYWVNGEDNSERFVTHLLEGEEYIENTYFGHNFVLSAHNFKVSVDVVENRNPGNNEVYPYLIKLENMAEEDSNFEFHIKSEYDVDYDEDEHEDEPLIPGDSLQITTGAEKWLTVYGVNDTLVATFEIMKYEHDEL